MSRVLRVVDVETTGLTADCSVIELGWVDLTGNPDRTFAITAPASKLFGCETPCPPEVIAVHHILPRDVEGLAPCAPADLKALAVGVDAMVAHSAQFEAQWFTPELLGETPLICTHKAALRVWPGAPSHSNQTLRYWRGLDLPADLAMPPHRAGPDAYVTAHILGDLIKAGATFAQLVAWTAEPALLPRCPIGKQRGERWADVEQSFLTWMVGKQDLDADQRWNAQRELDRRAQ